MKTTEQIQLDLEDLYLTNKSAKNLPYYNMQPSGDILKDFVKFTDLQCLKPSKDPNDYYIKNGGKFPPLPDKNGNYRHTVRDITWDTFHLFLPQLPPLEFYDMKDSSKEYVVKKIIKSGVITNSDAVNMFFGFCNWATGNFKKEKAIYKEWYGTNLQPDIDSLGDKTVFIRLLDIRAFRMTQSSFPGHLGGTLCFYKIFSNYTK